MQQIAKTAVVITQIIKTNLDKTPQEVIQLILTELPELTSDAFIDYMVTVGDSLGIQFKDINDLISKIQERAKDVTNLKWNSLWQEIAQAIYFVASVLKGFVPPKWRDVITVILGAYDDLKNK